MKTMMISMAILMMSSSVFATTVRVPYFVREQKTNKIYSMDKINRMLLAKGEKPFPEYAEFNEHTIGKMDHESYWKLFSQIDEALERAGYSNLNQQAEDVPGRLNTITRKTCFIGDANKVADILSQLGDTFYSDQMTMHGWKYKTSVHYPYDNEQEVEESLSRDSELWKNWNTKSDSVLIVSSVGDGGDDTQESVVGPCK